MKKGDRKRLITAVSIMVGTAIGAGVLGIPYVAAQAGFWAVAGYIVILGAIILSINLYLGEVVLRTKGHHQIPGYALRYLGKKGMVLMEFAMVFGIYSGIVAYMLGMGESMSFLFFGNSQYTTIFGILVGFIMSYLLWRGISALKKYEKMGVAIILLLLLAILVIFAKDVSFANLSYINTANIFLPFGVVLFALLSFASIPEIEQVLNKNEKLMKKTIILGTLIPVVFYIIFAFVVLGFMGTETPEIATLALGPFFILLGIFTMFTSYLASGNALEDNFKFDERMKKKRAWFLTSIIPIGIFLLIRYFDYFSFTRILSIGGVVSGGLTAILILVMAKRARKRGNRKPEYTVPINWIIIGILSLIFIFGVLKELIGMF